jgi:hypothetical protein
VSNRNSAAQTHPFPLKNSIFRPEITTSQTIENANSDLDPITPLFVEFVCGSGARVG